MQVIVEVKEGESLKLGIRTSNYMADGTRSTSDNHGWFKVDHFRIQKVNAVDDETSIQNSKFKVQNSNLGAVYDLSGRRVDSKFKNQNSKDKRGVYIMNGKKVVF